MAFPTTGIIDDFNRSDQTPPGPLWASTYIQNTVATGLNVVSNQLAVSGSSNNGYLLDDVGPDQELYATVAVLPPVGEYIGLFMRISSAGTSSWSGYALILVTGSTDDSYGIRRYDNGTPTGLLTPTSATLAVGEKIGMSVTGSTIRVYKTVGGVWSQVGSDVTDTTYASAGKMGIELSSTTIRLDDLGGTVAATTPASTAAPVVSGTVRQRSSLSCTTGSWSSSPTSYAYQWFYADTSQSISGATSSTYQLVYNDVGHTIQCQVTATNTYGDSTPAASNTTAAVALPAPDILVWVNGGWVPTALQTRSNNTWQ